MRKMRRLAALALTAVMTMAMSITAFATEAPKAKVTVNGADEATLKYVQVIKANTQTTTGWDIVDAYVKDFQKLPQMANQTDEQKLIEAYIGAKESDRSTVLSGINGTTEFTKSFEVSEAGLYVIRAEEKLAEGQIATYKYAPMAAYVGFEQETGKATSLVSTTLNAKKEPIKVVKDLVESTDDVVEIGRVVPYEVKSTVPYIPADKVATLNADSKILYGIKDSITGAEYVTNAAGTLDVTVTLDGEEVGPYTVQLSADKKSFTLDLSDLVIVNTNEKDDQTKQQPNANKAVVVTYKAKVTERTAVNRVFPIVGDHEYSDDVNIDTETSETAKLVVTKTGDKQAKLAGAKFVVVKVEKVDGKDVESYAILDSNKTFKEWTTNLDTAKNDANVLVTNANGEAEAFGFDKDSTYYFKETEAPTGYQLKADNSDAVDWVQKDATKKSSWVGSVTVADTKLASLPFTGGMGTTIFTVLGVAIMALAAALYFASKRSATK